MTKRKNKKAKRNRKHRKKMRDKKLDSFISSKYKENL